MNRLLVFLLLLPLMNQAQNSTQIVHKEDKSYVFGQIFTGFYTGLNDNFNPQSAFVFKQGIMGYKHTFKNKVSGLIMLDFTRTTHFTALDDTSGNVIPLNYFEGSKYTAYLKMAEIKWTVSEHFILRFGQLLNTQYLTFQDKFWGFRYVDVTFQEKYRFGMPADFGVQADYKLKEKLLLQLSVVNGEGPFRHQDKSGKFLYSFNIQYMPIKGFTLKLYTGLEPAPDTGKMVNSSKTMSFFAGFKNKKFALGGEANYLKDYKHIKAVDKYGFSVYGYIALNKKITTFARYDHLYQEFISDTLTNNYYILGMQYEPVRFLTTSLNFRYYSKNSFPSVNIDVGFKF